jgi:Xaa-Pro aminopeptidase
MKYPFLLYRGEHFNANFFHYSGVDVDHSFLIVEGKHQTLLTPKMNLREAAATFKGTVVPYIDVFNELKKLLKGPVGIDGMHVGFSITEKLKKFCKPEDVSRDLLRKRMVKNDSEISKIRNAVKETREIFANLKIKKGTTEAQIKRQLLLETLGRGLEPAFQPIVAADSNSSFPHYKTGNARINEMVLVDYGVRFKNYCADLTRCFFVKKDSKKKQPYKKIQAIFNTIVEQAPRLKTGKELADLSTRLFKKSKLPELPHAIGHGIGLEVHEFPRIGRKSTDKLAGSTFAIEPSAYFHDFGVRYENMVYFDGKRIEVF